MPLCHLIYTDLDMTKVLKKFSHKDLRELFRLSLLLEIFLYSSLKAKTNKILIS